MNTKPNYLDVLILSLFVIFITFQPFLLHHEIIYLDQGIHLPVIMALFKGAVPFKDFMYYRGPFELYGPAGLMKLFGMNMVWLPIFFYAWNVILFLLAVLIGKTLYRTRFILYLMVPVVLAKTFPRVSFYYWGGQRYALGLLGLLLVIQGIRDKKVSCFLMAGSVSAAAFFTTIEAGGATVLAILVAFGTAYAFKILDRVFILRSLKYFFGGISLIFFPYVVYMLANGSLYPYLEATILIPSKISTTFLQIEQYIPVDFGNFLLGMLPNSNYFKILTPVYFYLVLVGYLCYRMKRNLLDWRFAAVASIGVYGLILYIFSFRAIWGHHFEMALLPQKILLFFILEEIYLVVVSFWTLWQNQLHGMAKGASVRWKNQGKLLLAGFLIFSLAMSSLGFAFTRLCRRFVMPKLILNKISGKPFEDFSLLSGVEKRPLNIERAKGMVVPTWQADDIEATVDFILKNTKPGEYVFTYPELGNFNFWVDRPYVGRFPIATFSWADEGWHRELVSDFLATKPTYVIMTNLGHRTFPGAIYFWFPKNVEKFKEVTSLILEDYKPVKKLFSLTIYKRIRP